MNSKSNLTQRDIELLTVIDEILTNGREKQAEEHALYGFCELLASNVPEASAKFRYGLQKRLLHNWQQASAIGVETAATRGDSEVKSPTWLHNLLQRLNPPSRIPGVSGPEGTTRKAVLVSLILLLVASLTVAFVPPLRTAVLEAIEKIVVGPNTVAMQVNKPEDSDPGELPPDMWIIRTEIGNFGGNVPLGLDPIVRTVDNFEEAQALTDFHLLAPADLPEGYAFREAKLAPLGGTFWTILFYSGPGNEIIIAQLPGGPQPSDDPNVAVSVKSGVVTDGTLEAVEFDGHAAAWIDGHNLLWESDGISYEVGGLDLNLQRAIEIARSFE